MQKEEITKRFSSAGKSLKQAGYVFILIPIAALIVEVISAQKDINPEKLKDLVIISKFIYSLLCIVIASCLISAGKGLMGLLGGTEDGFKLTPEAIEAIDRAKKDPK
jgi:hypothetical protein